MDTRAWPRFAVALLSVALLVAALAAPSAAAPSPVEPELAAKLQTRMDQWRINHRAPGVAVAVRLPDGSRWIGTSAPDVGIHGTPDDASIGTYASHGCIRMHIPEVEQLYEHVALGMTVIIKP